MKYVELLIIPLLVGMFCSLLMSNCNKITYNCIDCDASYNPAVISDLIETTNNSVWIDGVEIKSACSVNLMYLPPDYTETGCLYLHIGWYPISWNPALGDDVKLDEKEISLTYIWIINEIGCVWEEAFEIGEKKKSSIISGGPKWRGGVDLILELHSKKTGNYYLLKQETGVSMIS